MMYAYKISFSECERMLKIGLHLPKLLTKINGFLKHDV